MVKKARIRQALDRRRAADLRERQKSPLMPRRQRRRTLFRRKKMVEHYRKNKKYLLEKEAAHCVARQHGCSASLVRHYDRLWRRKGLSALMPRSRAPHHPHRHLTMETIGLIVAIRVLTGWGAQRIARNLKVQSQGQVVVSHTSVWRVICRHHLPRRVNHPRSKCDGIAYRCYKRRMRNSLWHIDYKKTDKLIPGVPVTIMVVIDDSTRYCVAARARLGHPNARWTCEVLEDCIRQYGRPKQILTDNDPLFVGGHRSPQQCAASPSQFQHTIAPAQHLTTADYYPQCNGKAEALIRTLLVECLRMELADRGEAGFADLTQIQSVLDEFLSYYNLYREHSALDYHPPASLYLGKHLFSSGFAAVPRLKNIPMPFPQTAQSPGNLSAYEIQRCFALVSTQPYGCQHVG